MGSRGTTKETTMRKMLIPIALAATLACGFAQAQERSTGDRSATSGDRVDARQAQQANRIRSGVANGDLTRREASSLRSEQRGIRQMERHARADGVVTPREGRRLERAQDRASHNISRQRHDRQQRFAGWRGHDRGRQHAYGRGHDRGNHYAYGHRFSRGNHYAYGHGFNHRPQLAARGRFGRR
jgi:hypothetical protein